MQQIKSPLHFQSAPLSYSWNSLIHNSEGALNYAFRSLRVLNSVLAAFEGKKVDKLNYSYYLLVNSNLGTVLSLQKSIQSNCYMLERFSARQAIENLIKLRELFRGIDSTDLGKVRLKERLHQYGAYKIWRQQNQSQMYLKTDFQLDKDLFPLFEPESQSDYFSQRFHAYKDLEQVLGFSTEIYNLNERSRKGESLHNFLSVIDPHFKSVGRYIRDHIGLRDYMVYEIISSENHASNMDVDITLDMELSSIYSGPGLYHNEDFTLGLFKSRIFNALNYIALIGDEFWGNDIDFTLIMAKDFTEEFKEKYEL